MESRFPQRVALERRVLDMVNSSMSGVDPLVGLADVTVAVWVERLPKKWGVKRLTELEVALRLSAEAARSEADVSDEVFVDIDEEEAEVAIARLREALDQLGMT